MAEAGWPMVSLAEPGFGPNVEITVPDLLGAWKQSDSKGNLLDSLWNSVESYSKVFQSKSTATVVNRVCRINVRVRIDHHGLRIEVGREESLKTSRV
ncbi:hypothetical protein E3N88_04333 [Mikania micrantha]|uniref:Uncharacterized protein n=1 Tax=Mikania micrantha TaxID=192012 RepID=A0A5N6PU70_9ASTR|nr:hypothetical protein E3N88_04333 [Mikania micrantha]